jgi:hypothetical protein
MNSSTSETITNGRFDRGTKWIEIQKNTFTNWVNEQLRVSQSLRQQYLIRDH